MQRGLMAGTAVTCSLTLEIPHVRVYRWAVMVVARRQCPEGRRQ